MNGLKRKKTTYLGNISSTTTAQTDDRGGNELLESFSPSFRLSSAELGAAARLGLGHAFTYERANGYYSSFPFKAPTTVNAQSLSLLTAATPSA